MRDGRNPYQIILLFYYFNLETILLWEATSWLSISGLESVVAYLLITTVRVSEY